MPAIASSSVETNRALGPRFFAEQDRLRGGPAEELCAPEYRAVLGGYPPFDRAGHEAWARGFYAAFPDARHHIEDIVPTETHVVVRFVIRGTHTGDFFGIPATGRPVTVVANVIMEVAGGRVTTLKGIFDEAGMLRQLGVLPSS